MEKRSNDQGFAQGELFDNGSHSGVGARQAGGRRPAGGGRYPKICGIQNFQLPNEPPPDPRLLELEKIGMHGAWLRLARRVGFDVFLDIWRAVCADETTRHDGGRRMPKLREFDSYLRYQRNLYVKSLSDAGMNATQVQKLLRQNLREPMSIEHVQRLMAKR